MTWRSRQPVPLLVSLVKAPLSATRRTAGRSAVQAPVAFVTSEPGPGVAGIGLATRRVLDEADDSEYNRLNENGNSGPTGA